MKKENKESYQEKRKNMNKKEIKDYLKMVNELETKLTGKDKETYAWLIYGYNQCAKLLNETEKQVKKQKEAIDKVINLIVKETKSMPTNGCKIRLIEILDILNKVSE
mgnify:CR=1 FL=1